MPSSTCCYVRNGALTGGLLLAALGACDPVSVAQEVAPIPTWREVGNTAATIAGATTAIRQQPIMTERDRISANPPCPGDAILVEGEHCPHVQQVCERWDPSSARGAERCLRFRQPSRCLSAKRTLLRFCIDRFEWPNRQGVKPRLLTSWQQAQDLCASVGKRLCDDFEWLFACEGPEMLPYTHGFDRDPTACVVDRLYQAPNRAYEPWDTCWANPECAAALERIEQSEPAGSFGRCKSPFEVFDMNGNANEWVNVPGAHYPRRSGLKGGWWGPVRSRCRPTVRFHKEDDWGYEVGFRCCQNARPDASPATENDPSTLDGNPAETFSAQDSL